MTPRIETAEDALGLILDWAGRDDVEIPPRKANARCPDALPLIAAVSDRLGPDFSDDEHYGTLLFAQDRICRPEDLRSEAGMTLFVDENQSVWAYGFRDENPSALFVTGDWCDRTGSRTPEDWRAIEATTEDALISVILSNGVIALSTRFDTILSEDFETVPSATDVLLWAHPAWTNWPGFWTNDAGTRLHFGGMGMTLRRGA